MEDTHWTDRVNMNYKFLAALNKDFGTGEKFSLRQAYEVNERTATHREWTLRSDAWCREHGQPLDREWIHMSVRNMMCKYVHLGILERVERGVYRFRVQST